MFTRFTFVALVTSATAVAGAVLFVAGFDRAAAVLLALAVAGLPILLLLADRRRRHSSARAEQLRERLDAVEFASKRSMEMMDAVQRRLLASFETTRREVLARGEVGDAARDTAR